MMKDYVPIRNAFEKANQLQVFRFWDTLQETEKAQFIEELSEVDLDELKQLCKIHLNAESTPDLSFQWAEINPPKYIPQPTNKTERQVWVEAHQRGEEALKKGQVAAFTVAGGQGTRLGFDAPKGTFPATPIEKKSLFQIFSEKLLAARERYETSIPWYIMTSQANHQDTVDFFKAHNFFGLPKNEVIFFSQGRMAAIDFDGKIILQDKAHLAMNPDGHGGSLRALVRSGAIQSMQERDIRIISYFQVDNPLAQCIDPSFIGFHIAAQSEMSSKMIKKTDATEKVGLFCSYEGKTQVAEYSDMPQSLQDERNPDGSLKYHCGSIAIHLLDVDFVARMGGAQSSQESLPFHKAIKKIPCVDEQGQIQKPEEPNGIKFELFVFDALPFAPHSIVVETLRENEFSPIKNACGSDSPESSQHDQIQLWLRWVKAAGLKIETTDKPLVLEVSPLFADTEEAFIQRCHERSLKTLHNGDVLK